MSPPCRVVVGSNGDRRPLTLLMWEGWVWGPPYRPGNRGPTRSTCSFQLQTGSVCAFQNPKRTNCSGRVSMGSACAFQEPARSNCSWQVPTWSTHWGKNKKKDPWKYEAVSDCHESGSWASLNSPQEVTRSPHGLLHYTHCCTPPQTTIPIAHCTDDTRTEHTADCTEHTADCSEHTADCSDHTTYINHGLPLCRVLFSI